MITLHGKEVKVGDKVWHLFYGWGEVEELHVNYATYPICVQFERGYRRGFTQCGRYVIQDETPTLFWQPVEFEIPKKPNQKEKAWQWICKNGDEYWMTIDYFASKEAVLALNPHAEPIEPYLPSEIERERSE